MTMLTQAELYLLFPSKEKETLNKTVQRLFDAYSIVNVSREVCLVVETDSGNLYFRAVQKSVKRRDPETGSYRPTKELVVSKGHSYLNGCLERLCLIRVFDDGTLTPIYIGADLKTLEPVVDAEEDEEYEEDEEDEEDEDEQY